MQREITEWVNEFYRGDVRNVATHLPANSVHTVITSPPYWGLRSYEQDESQIGLEDSVDEYVNTIVDVMDIVGRVLRPDGSLWLNLGDTYSGGGGVSGKPDGYEDEHDDDIYPESVPARDTEYPRKNKLLIPERVALAMQERGWILRNDVTWDKDGSQMPEAVTDRMSTRTEDVFHFVRDQDYWFDMEAVKDDGVIPTDVWEVTTAQHGESACAVFPLELLEKPIEATTPGTVCRQCTTPYEQAETGLRQCCGCSAGVMSGVVFDPFCGVGTTAIAAEKHGQSWIGIDNSEEYLEMARNRMDRFRRDPGIEGVDDPELARKIQSSVETPDWW